MATQRGARRGMRVILLTKWRGDRRGMMVALPTMRTWGVGARGLQGDGVAPVTGDPRSAGHACSGS